MRRWRPFALVAGVLHCAGGLSSAAPPLEPEQAVPAPPVPAVAGQGPLGQGETCLEALAHTGAVFTEAPASHSEPPYPGCGMIDGVVVSRGPSGLRYRPPIEVSCAFALTLPEIESVIRDTAAQTVATPIDTVRTMGSYGCRQIQSQRSPGRLSQHAFGNAFDLGELWGPSLRVSVLRDFRSPSPEGAFLRLLSASLRAIGALERVLDPDYNSVHRNHFHLEGRPRSGLAATAAVESENR